MITTAIVTGLVLVGSFAWVKTASGYESAEYEVIQSDGKFEVRQYPDLMLVATSTKIDAQGRDGSFMKLFRYISGDNEADQKISMTTPVFMENDETDSKVQMGFVMPKQVTTDGVPTPTGPDVAVRKRVGGRFAVVQFSGRLSEKIAKEKEVQLREWMAAQNLSAIEEGGGVEVASYDAPYVPGPMRRNEVLIRLK